MKQMEILRLKELSQEINIIADKLLSEYQTPIESLNFSKRLFNALKRNGVDFVEQVLVIEKEEFLRMRNFGKGCLSELSEKLKVLGFEGCKVV